ncbi:hypothetical protein DYB37_012532 [Aphanomyces astaci]|uniref:Uncharacterized protein n=1 Tax=Aphanomyces astaci TaxID=112090 RepID=A0A3R7E3T1_APHAT|nr:hypothetical protein DYB35_002073 [Aphanomyces astaci]RHZ11763.1 hypothetical protein DYB37_012532 [Aphanomyces astaci]
MFASLQEETVRDQVFLDDCLQRHGDAVDERVDDPDTTQPIIDKTLEATGIEGFKVMTNFTPTEFDILWDIVQLPMKTRSTE